MRSVTSTRIDGLRAVDIESALKRMSSSDDGKCDALVMRMGIEPPLRCDRWCDRFDDTPQNVRRQGRGIVTRDMSRVRCLPADAGVVFMTRLLTLSLVAACAFVASAAPQQPIFRGTSDAVRVFVT